MLNLFALVNDPAARVQRFSLAREVQAELTTYLEQQEQAFNACSDQHEFDGKYKPDAGELLFIDDFDDIDKLGSAIQDPMSVPEVAPTIDLFEKIKALFSGRVESDKSVTVLLQAFDRRRVLSTNGLTIFQSNNVFKKVEGLGLTVDSKLTASLTGKRLRFASFHNARQIFDLSGYFVEATDADIAAFADMEMIGANKSALVAMADTWIRRKLALVQQSQILTEVPVADIATAALAFGIEVAVETVDGGIQRLVLPEAKADLKNLLRFLDDDFYEATLSKTQYVTNSKRPAKVKKD
ncbi:hypothetical protein ACQ858_13240 [Variovorax ureilyticus]|uniref:hypothetical protein n=1 Tax=Variovorax ureilyticus TaxID=1836198 RepID=UPI003D67B7AC